MGRIRIETAGRAIEFEIDVARTAHEDQSTEDDIRATLRLANDGDRALKPLVKALGDDDRLSNQLAALQALESLHEQGVDVSPAYEFIVQAVKDGQPQLALAAEETFARLGPDAAGWLMRRMEAAPDETPGRLCEAIGRNTPRQDLIDFVRAGVNSEDYRRRMLTASIIEEVFKARPESADQEMVEILYRLQSDSVDWVRGSASAGLAGAPETVDVDFARLIRNIEWNDDPFGAFSGVHRTIGAQRRRAIPAIPALLELRRNPPPGPYPSPSAVRLNATNALCMIDPEGIPTYLRELVDIDGAVTCGEILITLEGDLPLELLREWMADNRPMVVETALATAAINGAIGADLAPEMINLLQAREKEVRLASAKALRDTAKLLKQFSRIADEDEKAAFKDSYNRAIDQVKAQLSPLHKMREPGSGVQAPTRKIIDVAIKQIEALQPLP